MKLIIIGIVTAVASLLMVMSPCLILAYAIGSLEGRKHGKAICCTAAVFVISVVITVVGFRYVTANSEPLPPTQIVCVCNKDCPCQK